MCRWIVALLVLVSGCAGESSPTWAFEPLWMEPAGDGVHGFQTWNLYAEKWAKKFDESYFLCAIVVELDGVAAAEGEACPECTETWIITAEVLETDCDDALARDPGFTSLSRVGLGPVAPDLVEGDPYPAQSQGGYVDYSTGDWLPHGWAYPEALDTRGQAADSEWDGEQAFTFWPAWYWDLAEGAAGAS